jgi:hypothetical protein
MSGRRGWVGQRVEGDAVNVDIQILVLSLMMVMILFLAVQFQIRSLSGEMDEISRKIDKLLDHSRDA